MNDSRNCPECGNSIQGDRSVCKSCLMRLALEGGDAPDGARASKPGDSKGDATGQHGERASAASAAAMPEPGTRIGPYRVVKLLGQGGMGAVYLADQTAPVERRVALKVIKLGLDTAAVLQRFQAEQQALARMDHAGIARLFEAGQTDDGRPYFVMEYVDGEPLTDYCDRARLDVGRRLELFNKVCTAVQHAHQKGIVHRDLKPSNVLVAEVGEGDHTPQPTVIDFGVAKAIERPLTENTMFTEQGVMLGTPEYMSPEQAALDPLAVDTRTDVYALGVLLYELLTGVLPFESAELRKAGFDEIRRRIREDHPPKPSTRIDSLGAAAQSSAELRRRPSSASLCRDLAGDLDLIAMKALDKDPDRRYASPSELAADVGRYLRREPVLAQPPSALYQLRKLIARNPLASAAIAVLLVTLLGFSIWMSWLYRQSQQNLERALAAESEATQVSDFLVGVFEISDPGEARGNSATARELLDKASDEIAFKLTGQPRLQATMMSTMGRVYQSLGLYDRAGELIDDALARRRSLLGDDAAAVAGSLAERAILDHELGQFDEAEANANEALAILEKELGPDHLEVARAHYILSLTAHNRGRAAEAVERAKRVLAIQEQALGAEDPETIQSRNHLANIYRSLGEAKTAMALHEEVLEQRRRILGENHPDTAHAYNDVAENYRRMEQFDKAEPNYRRVVEIYEQIYDADHPDLGYIHNNMGLMYRYQNRFEEAEASYREAIRVRRESLPENHPLIAWTTDNLGMLFLVQDRFDEAEEQFLAAQAIARESVGEESTDFAILLNNLAELRLETGRFDEAEALYNRALGIHKRTVGDRSMRVSDVLYNLADLYQQRGRLDASIKAYEESLSICEEAYGADHPDSIDTRKKLEAVRSRRDE